MKRFRASIYIDVTAETEQQAKSIAEEVALHLVSPDVVQPPDSYSSPFVGGVGEITNDLSKTLKNLERI